MFEFENLDMNIDEITGKPEKNCIIVISDGKVKKLELPDWVELKLRCTNGRVQVAEVGQQLKF